MANAPQPGRSLHTAPGGQRCAHIQRHQQPYPDKSSSFLPKTTYLCRRGDCFGLKEHPALAMTHGLKQGMDDADQGAEGDQPGGIDPETQEQEEADKDDKEGERVTHGGGGKLGGDPQHQPQSGHVDPVQESARPGGIADAGNQEAGGSNEEEGGKEDTQRGQNRPGNAPEQITDKGGGGKHGPRGDLSDGDGIDQLLVGEPAEALDEVSAQIGQQDVTAAVKRGPDLQEVQEKNGQAEGNGTGQKTGAGERQPEPDHRQAFYAGKILTQHGDHPGGEKQEQDVHPQKVEGNHDHTQQACQPVFHGFPAQVP